MNLKEAFQAQNKLNSLLEFIRRYLSVNDNIMSVTEKHLRSKALAGQQDETIDCSNKEDEDFSADSLVTVWRMIIKEKEKLGLAIGWAKSAMDFNLDAAVDLNKSRRNFIETLECMAGQKSSHSLRKDAGKGYVFNNEGNQTPYYYDIDRIYTIDYDRNKIRGLLNELYREADALSIKIDGALLSATVDYEPQFDLYNRNDLIIEELLKREQGKF